MYKYVSDYGTTLKSRLASFKTWPKNHPKKKEDLADAGLIFTGKFEKCLHKCMDKTVVKDSYFFLYQLIGQLETGVFCFQCKISITDWKENDDPWVKHTQSNSDCDFIISQKGQAFINEVKTMKIVRKEKSKEETDSTKEVTEVDSANLEKVQRKSKKNKQRVEINDSNDEETAHPSDTILRYTFEGEKFCQEQIKQNDYQFGAIIGIASKIIDGTIKLTPKSKEVLTKHFGLCNGDEPSLVWFFIGCNDVFPEEISNIMQDYGLLSNLAKYRFENVERTIITFKDKIADSEVEAFIRRNIKESTWLPKSKITVICGHHHELEKGKVVLGEADSKLFVNYHSVLERLCKNPEFLRLWEINEYHYKAEFLPTIYNDDDQLELTRSSKLTLKNLFHEVIDIDKPHVLIFASCYSYYSEIKTMMASCGLLSALSLSAEKGALSGGTMNAFDRDQKDVFLTFTKVCLYFILIVLCVKVYCHYVH